MPWAAVFHHVGDYQNYGPFLGPHYNTGPNTGPYLRDPKRDHNFDNPPCPGFSLVASSLVKGSCVVSFGFCFGFLVRDSSTRKKLHIWEGLGRVRQSFLRTIQVIRVFACLHGVLVFEGLLARSPVQGKKLGL